MTLQIIAFKGGGRDTISAELQLSYGRFRVTRSFPDPTMTYVNVDPAADALRSDTVVPGSGELQYLQQKSRPKMFSLHLVSTGSREDTRCNTPNLQEAAITRRAEVA